MRWLVTGCSGFTGRHLRRRLESLGHQVWGVGLGDEDDIVCDLTDSWEVRRAVEMVRPHRVVHLAALSFVAHPRPDEFERVNVGGTVNLLDACAHLASPPAVALASSAAVYGRQSGRLAEDSGLNPVNAYGRSKLAMEESAAAWASRLPIVVTRPFNYTGPGQDARFLVPKIAAAFRQGDAQLRLGRTDVKRDFSDVRDVVEDYILLLGDKPALGAVNLCSGVPLSVDEILDAFRRIAGPGPEVVADPALLRADEVDTLSGDPSRLIALTGRGHGIPLERTLADLLAGTVE